MYYCLSCLKQVRFLNFQHIFFCFDFEQNLSSIFFHDSNHFQTFYPLRRRRKILIKISPSQKKCLLSKPIAYFGKVQNCLNFVSIKKKIFEIFQYKSSFKAHNLIFFGKVENNIFLGKFLCFRKKSGHF